MIARYEPMHSICDFSVNKTAFAFKVHQKMFLFIKGWSILMVDGETRDYMKKKMKWRKLALAWLWQCPVCRRA